VSVCTVLQGCYYKTMIEAKKYVKTNQASCYSTGSQYRIALPLVINVENVLSGKSERS